MIRKCDSSLKFGTKSRSNGITASFYFSFLPYSYLYQVLARPLHINFCDKTPPAFAWPRPSHPCTQRESGSLCQQSLRSAQVRCPLGLVATVSLLSTNASKRPRHVMQALRRAPPRFHCHNRYEIGGRRRRSQHHNPLRCPHSARATIRSNMTYTVPSYLLIST